MDHDFQGSPNPRDGGCVRCGRTVLEHDNDDKAVGEFFDRLASAFPMDAMGRPPASFREFRRQCEQRERAGRASFGEAYLTRDNIAEALEEAADGANYAFFDLRVEGTDDDLALMIAYRFAQAHELLLQLRAKRLGSP